MSDSWPDVKGKDKNGPSIGSATRRLRTYKTSRGETRVDKFWKKECRGCPGWSEEVAENGLVPCDSVGR